MAMAGNSFDKSLLLSAMLTHWDYQVQFTRGRLTDDQAQALVKTMYSQAAQNPGAGRAPVFAGPLAEASNDMANRVVARWSSSAQEVRDALHHGRRSYARSSARQSRDPNRGSGGSLLD